MKKRTLLTCLALTGVLGLSSTAYASEVSVQSLIDGSSQTETETGQAETETTSTQNTDSPESKKTVSNGQVVPGTNLYDAGVIPFNTKIHGTATAEVYNWYTFTTGSTTGTEYKITCVNTSQGPGWDGVAYTDRPTSKKVLIFLNFFKTQINRFHPFL